MFEGNKWARQSAIVVLIHTAAWGVFQLIGVFWVLEIGAVESFFIALAITALIIVVIHRSNGNQLFKGKRWKDEAQITLLILGVASYFLGEFFFPLTMGVTHALVWYIRKKTGGDKEPKFPMDDAKIGSPF